MARSSRFFSELRRRQVFKVAAAYAVVGWLVIQFADTVFPALHLPGWTTTLVVVLTLLGFPPALVLAWAYELTPEGVRRTEPPSGAAQTPPTAAAPVGRRGLVYLGAASLIVLLGVGGYAFWRGGDSAAADATALEANAVVVLPFRVSGDASLAYLREGMVELLAAKLTGEAGELRAVDAGTVLSAWRRAAATEAEELPQDAAVRLARELGAGRLLVGGLVGTPSNLSLHVSLLDSRSGAATSSASVQGGEEQLHELIDRLVAELLTRAAGEEQHRLDYLTSTSLPALRTFLIGRAAHRRGDYETALREYARALDLDSTFALAGFGIVEVSGWVSGSEPVAARGGAIARRYQERLSERDRVGLAGRIAPRDPERPPSALENLEAVEHALRRWPDHARLWYLRGDHLFHHGWTLGIEGWEERARESFERAIELDPDFAEPVHHLAATLALMGDTAALRGFVAHQFERVPSGPVADYLRWRTRYALGDASPFRVPPLDSMDTDATLAWIGIEAQDLGFALRDGARAVQLQQRRPGIRDQHFSRRLGALSYALNGGQPTEALAILRSLPEVQSDPHFHQRLSLLTALYADGDIHAAERAADTLADGQAEGAVGAMNACILAQWRVHTHERDPGTAPGPVPSNPESWDDYGGPRMAICAAVLEAQRSAGDDPTARHAARERLEALLAMGRHSGSVWDGHTEYAHLALARLHEAAGDPAAALRALQRRTHYLGWQPYLASQLREEGRLAALTGDREGAIRAYEHYLAFRTDPEPALRAEVERVRRKLAALRGERGR
jgi:tetratricopeptide (TPR) repeat protein